MEHHEPQQVDWHTMVAERDVIRRSAETTFGLLDWATTLSVSSPDWLLPGLIQSGSLHILTSDTGCCKTWLGLSFMLSGLYGIPVLRTPPARPFSTLYLAADSPIQDIGRQLRKLKLGHSIGYHPPQQDAHAFVMPDGFRFDEPQHVVQIRDLIRAWDIDLLVLDVILQTHSGDENDNGFMGRVVLRNMKLLRDQTGCAIFALHHNGKPRLDGTSVYRGASTIIQSVEHHFAARHSYNGIRLTREKNRGDEAEFPASYSYTLARTPEGGRLLEPDATPPPALLQLLADGPRTRASLIAATGFEGKQLDNALQYLRRAEKVTRTEEGLWTLSA